MNAADWQRLQEAFSSALDLPPSQREAFLRERLGDAPELLKQGLAMLAASPPSNFLGEAKFPAGRRLEVGEKVGDYELVSLLGQGGMGLVYLARQPSLDRLVALKVLSVGPGTPQRRIDRFQREVRAVARLRHPGIVQVYGHGMHGDAPWFAMELVPGHDLHTELVRQRRARSSETVAGEPSFLPAPGSAERPRAVVELCAQVAEALAHAHESGIVHRDIKPSNLLLQADLRVQVTDFGIALDESLGSLTRTGEMAGTPHYMSPEQVDRSAPTVDQRTDIYSLGVVLYELLTLSRPFEGETLADVLTGIRDRQPRPIRALDPSLPKELDTLCRTAMAKDPAERYPNAAEFASDLQRFAAGEPILAQPIPWPRLAARWTAQRRGVLAAGALLAVGTLSSAWFTSARLASRSKARLDVRARDEAGRPVAGRVSVRPIDPFSGAIGEARPVGSLPLTNAPVAAGYVRVVVDLAGGTRRSFTRHLEPGLRESIDIPLGPHQRGTSGMVWIAPGILSVRDEDSPHVPFNGLDVAIDGFWLDEAEVSNADWRVFLEATGHPPPAHWERVEPSHDELPVAQVSWFDALAFAEWSGKRLPSFAEWTWAARGSENRLYPWTGAVEGEPRGNVFRERIRFGPGEQEDHYFRYAAPVRSFPEARSPEGVYHLFGNVAEWTESPPIQPLPTGRTPRMQDRIAAGHPWDAARVGWEPGHDLRTFLFAGLERESALFLIGLRCAADDPEP